MNKFRSTALYLAAGAAMVASAATDDTFRSHFADSTLRIDVVAGGEQARPSLMLRSMSKSPHWAGRRFNLDRQLLRGNGFITAVDSVSGDTVYAGSFSSLFSEWAVAPGQGDRPQAFEHTVMMPLPKATTTISVGFTDARGNVATSASWTYRPGDILVARRRDTTPYQTRYIHGSRRRADKAIDVAILAEGYTKADRKQFFEDASAAVEAILAHEPFASMADRFNFVAVMTPSADRGVSVPLKGRWADTAFDSHFSTLYSDRYLTIPSIFSLYDALDGIAAEHIIVLANTSEYGGGGIFNDYTLTASRHYNFREVVVHEFGHSFGGLADEYFYEGDVMDNTYPADAEPWEPNVTTLVDFHGKWEHLLPDGTMPGDSVSEPGLFEGAAYSFKGFYRSADNCRMRTNDAPGFCPACRLALERMIRHQTEPEASLSGYTEDQ